MENPALDFTGTTFSVRTKNALHENSISTLGQLIVWHKNKSLPYIGNLGAKSENEIISFLATHDQTVLDNSLSTLQQGSDNQDIEFLYNTDLSFYNNVTFKKILLKQPLVKDGS